jgi:hypothetical protein
MNILAINYGTSDPLVDNIVSPPRLLSRGAPRASATAGLTWLPSLLGTWPGDRLGVRAIFVGGAPGEPGRGCRCASGGSDLFHRLGLRSFGALGDLKLDLVAFIQGLEARRGNGRVVDEDIRTIILRDEPKPFLVVKPLHGTTSHDMILLTWGEREGRHASSEDHKKTAHGLTSAVAVS